MNSSTVSGTTIWRGRRGIGALFAVSGLVVVSSTLAGCSGLDNGGHAQVSVAVPAVNVAVPNPLASHAVSLVSKVAFDASGLLKAGTYPIGQHSLVLAHDTPFKLKADVPVTGAKPDLSAGDADFMLVGTATVDGIAMPRHVTLKDHKASADVDVVGTLISAVESRLPKPDDAGEADARKLGAMLAQLTVSSARIDLRAGEAVDVAGAQLKFAPGSNLAFSNVRFVDGDNFSGECAIRISAKDVHATVGDGKVAVGEFKFGCDAKVVCANDQLAVTLMPGAVKPSLSFGGCAVSRGSDAIKLVAGALAPDTFDMNIRRHDWQHAAFVVAGKMQTKVSNPKGTFGIPNFNADVGSLGVQFDDKQKRVSFGDLRVTLAAADLQDLVASHLPRTKVVKLHKELVHQTPWRYRNLTIDSVEVQNPKIAGLKIDGRNAASLSCSASARVDGTVQKEHPLGALLRRNGDGPDAKLWIAKAVLGGPAAIKFTVAPGKTFADAKVNADVDFTLNRLDKLDVDWSGVSASIAGKAESGVIHALLAALKKYVSSKGIAVQTTVATPMFKHPDARLKMLTLKTVSVSPVAGGTQVVASGYVELN